MTDTLAPPPPAAADPPPARTPLKLEMIKPPVRGDVPAWRWFWFGIGFYALFALLLIGTLLRVSGGQSRPAALLQMFGLGGAHWNLPLFALVVGGVWLTVRAALMVRDDIGTLAREEEDIDWVLKTRENGVALVFLDPAERERRFAAGEHTLPADARIEVETLLDDRVRRVFEAAQASGATHVPVDELRGIAEKRTARLGGFARFASSLLLLLAVLGTFAGVKTALPSLIDAVAAAGGSGSDANPASPSSAPSSSSSPSSPSPSSQSSVNPLVEPLRAVADAFGGNALALVGAIAVGLMAQGLAFGRRNLLERLELVSAEYIYDRRRSGSADPLRVAVETLADTAGEVRDATQSLSGIEGELQGLSEAFREAFESLNERLTDIVVQQDSMLHQRTSESLDQLGRHVAALAQTVDANTRAYAGIVDRVGERSAEARAALERMEEANRALTLALEGISRLGDVSGQAAAAVEERLAAIGLGTMQVRERMDGIADEVERARPALETMEVALRSATDRIAGIDERAAKAWAGAAEQINTRLEKIAAAPAAVATSGGGAGMSADAVSLLRRIATGVEASRPPSPVMLATLPLLGTLGAIAIVYVLWEGVPRLLALFGIG